MKRDLWYSVLVTLLLLPSVHSLVSQEQERLTSKPAVTVQPIEYELGFAKDSFLLEPFTIKNGETLGNLFSDLNVPYTDVVKIIQNMQGLLNYKKIQAGSPYYLVTAADTSNHNRYLVYQPSVTAYYTIQLQDSFLVQKTEFPVEIRLRAASAVIESSLWNALVDNGLSPELAVNMSDIYAWSVNFFKLQKGDRFKLFFEEKWANNQMIGYGKIYGAVFNASGEDFYAIPFTQGKDAGYYNEKGKSLEADFLKSPLRFSKITSGFSMNRFHPVQRRWKAHLGTDFAAPTGTPILSTANGVVEAAGYNSGNGNYVKIKHHNSIETQYLHMSRFASGIHVGKAVKQGEVIGFVGSTGLATGPHVCYRFWKSGVQVNSQGIRITSTKQITDENRKEFETVADNWVGRLAKIPYPKEGEQMYAQHVSTDTVKVAR
ncbi:MAG: hypothetical protein RIS47_1551 [Bacteroidota bacterium]|jgi:murein DD-endopeptidase MepM/ murein hydrolase activator NlpD